MPNLKLSKDDVAGYALLTGSLERVFVIAEKLDHARQIAQHREFITVSGYYKSVKLTVTSTGIGAPSSVIALEELTQLGVHTFIRVGTSGSLQEAVDVGDVVVATGAVRDEGTSPAYVPLYYPAIAHFEIIEALREGAQRLGKNVILGIVHSKDALRQELPQGIPLIKQIEHNWRVLRGANVLCTEMESSALFVVGAIRKVRVGAVIVSAGLTYQGEPDIENEKTQQGMDNAIDIALEAINHLSESS